MAVNKQSLIKFLLLLGLLFGYFIYAPLTQVFHAILTTPYPYWSVILLSCIGTFLSVGFGDEIMNVVKPQARASLNIRRFIYKLILIVVIFLLIFFVYYELITTLEIQALVY